VLVLTALSLALGCGDPATWPLTRVPPPDSWSADNERWREARERFVRESPDSPLPEPARASFTGLAWYPPDPDAYYVGMIQAYPEPQTFEIPTTAGASRPCAKLGFVEFELAGERRRLQVYHLLDTPREDGQANLFLPFLDATSGSETYAAGRYVDLVGPPGGPWVLDFNRAYNPSCAYGDPSRFACPRTPAENRIPLRVEAGERGFAHGAEPKTG
jgi:uncharacterized protein (DUF1684 family)